MHDVDVNIDNIEHQVQRRLRLPKNRVMFVEIHEHPENTAGPAVKPVKPYSCISADDLVREGRDAAVKAAPAAAPEDVEP